MIIQADLLMLCMEVRVSHMWDRENKSMEQAETHAHMQETRAALEETPDVCLSCYPAD